MEVTLEMVKAAKPAAYTGHLYNSKLRKLSSVCWPAVKFKGRGAVVVLEQRKCASVADAEKLAAEILADRLKDMLKAKDKKSA